MKNVLLLVHDDAGQEARLQTALDLVRALDGHLSCIDVSVMPIPTIGVYEPTGEAMLLDMEREREADNKTRLTPRLNAEGVSWNWIDTTDSIADAVLQAASLADLVVLNRRLDSTSHPDMRNIASDVVVHVKKPVVAVPETLKRFELGRALVAWDGREASAAALRACVPLLALAEEVLIFTVQDDSNVSSPTQAAEYLSRHDIHATIRQVEDKETPVEELIVKEATDWQADYIVMGAYSQGRMVELFGGVTKKLLTSSAIPLILAH
jgi:nucleotide-binding universal stress UspA family protein